MPTSIAWARSFARGVDHCLSSLHLGAPTDKALNCEAIPKEDRCTHLEDTASLRRARVAVAGLMATEWPVELLVAEDSLHRENGIASGEIGAVF